MTVPITLYACSICNSRWDTEAEAYNCELGGPLYAEGTELNWLRTNRKCQAYATIGKLRNIIYRGHKIHTCQVVFPDGDISEVNPNYIHVNVEIAKIMKFVDKTQIPGEPDQAVTQG